MVEKNPATFIERLFLVAGTQETAELARLVNITYNTMKNYVQGRLPEAKVLITIAENTGVNLNWLLLGKGEMLESSSVHSIRENQTIELVLPIGYRVVMRHAEEE